MAIKKDKLITLGLIVIYLEIVVAYLLLRNEKFGTVHNKLSKIPPPTSVHFATRVRRSRVVRLSWSSRFFV